VHPLLLLDQDFLYSIKIEGSWLKKRVVQVDDAECMILVDDHELAKCYAKNKEGKKNKIIKKGTDCLNIYQYCSHHKHY
jgi:hypothetical protein